MCPKANGYALRLCLAAQRVCLSLHAKTDSAVNGANATVRPALPLIF